MRLHRSKHQSTPAKTCGGCCTRLIDFGVRLGNTTILKSINLHVHCGELTALIGPNGAGKSTLFRAMLGEIPHSGLLQFAHSEDSRHSHRPHIGYVPQKVELDAQSPVSVLDLFAAALSGFPLWLGCRRRIRRLTEDALTVVQAAHLTAKKLGQLSGGELQRVLLALALTPEPDLLLLDEPISGFDPAGVEMFYRMISDLRRHFDLSILLATHDLAAVARVADRMVLLNRTILGDGSPREVLTSAEVGRIFGTDQFRVRQLPDAAAEKLPGREVCTICGRKIA